MCYFASLARACSAFFLFCLQFLGLNPSFGHARRSALLLNLNLKQTLWFVGACIQHKTFVAVVRIEAQPMF